MENKTVKMISEEYSKCTNDMMKSAYLEKMKLVHYLPITEKSRLITSTLTRRLLSFSDTLVTYDSIDKVVFFMLSVIEGYTDWNIEEPYSDFDALMDSGLMAAILVEIGPDVDAYRDLFEMCLNDYMRDHNSTEAVVARKMNELMQPISTLVESANEFIKKLKPSDVEHFLKLIK